MPRIQPTPPTPRRKSARQGVLEPKSQTLEHGVLALFPFAAQPRLQAWRESLEREPQVEVEPLLFLAAVCGARFQLVRLDPGEMVELGGQSSLNERPTCATTSTSVPKSGAMGSVLLILETLGPGGKAMRSTRNLVGAVLACAVVAILALAPRAQGAGWAVGTAGTILKSTDAGATWSGTNPTTNHFLAVYFINDNTGWAAGTGGAIFRTTNGGTNWTGTNPTTATLNGVFFIDANTGWAVGTGGTILKTTNGGTSWTATNPTTATLNSVFFADANTGWAVGTGGAIFKTTNGGTNWSGTFPTTAILNSVFFVSSTTGWAVGTTGSIFKTTNGGTSWTGTNPTSTTLNSVFFLDASTGWAVGGAGTILKTTNGGTNWTSTNPATAEFKCVRFINSTTGWAVGTGGAIYKTTNAGALWTGTFPTTATLYGVFFASIPVNISVTVNSSPAGRSFSVDGVAYTTQQVFTWVSGSSHTIATTSPQAGAAGTQYFWSSWSDAGAISHSVAPTANVTYTANFTTQYMLSMNAGAGGTVSPASGFRNAASVVSITATPSAGYVFSGWTGTGTGSYSGLNNPGSITMSGPITEIGNFAPTVSVTVGTSPAGRAFSVDGVSYTSAHAFTWMSGSSHNIATTSTQAGTPGTQYVWSSWSDGGAISHSAAPTTNATYTANFVTQYQLTMSAGTGGTVSPATGFHDAASVVSIGATSSAGYAFTAWSGSGPGSYSGSNNPASVTMSGPISESGSFAPTTDVTVGSDPLGLSFTVDGSPYTTSQAFSWPSGSSHTIGTTSPQAGGPGVQYVWNDWSDGGTIQHAVAPTGPAAYTARFKTQYLLTMSAAAGGTASPATQWQDADSVVQITATPNPGSAFAFDAWSGTGSGSYSGSNNPATITMSGPISETASFVDLTGVDDPSGVPRVFFLGPNRPNPAAGRTSLTFSLPKGGRASLRVFDVRGRLVAILADGELAPAKYVREWDTRDLSGHLVGSGIYYARLESREEVRTRPMVILR